VAGAGHDNDNGRVFAGVQPRRFVPGVRLRFSCFPCLAVPTVRRMEATWGRSLPVVAAERFGKALACLGSLNVSESNF
jgi:hypothetical protein